jgi:general secretion pathway protein E
MNARIDSAAWRDTGLTGMSDVVRAMLLAALSAPAGLILFAGPAGSGRSGALDAALALCRRPGATIAGRIGCRASAEQAVQASLEGRIVLAAIEADDAVGAIGLLCALHGEPSLVAAMLRASFAQRRVRRLCACCRHPVQAPAALSARLGLDAGAIVWRADGCADCSNDGLSGTIGLFEGIAIDPAMRRLIGGGGDAAVLASHAYRDRPNLGAAARALARDGEISGEDAARISVAQSQ